MRNYIKIFLLAVGAGLSIGVGGIIYLSVDNKIIGSLLFTVGLYAVVLNGLYLYTGKVGYLVNEKDRKSYGLVLLVTWAGNFAGAALAAGAVLMTRIAGIKKAVSDICQTKLCDNPFSILVLAVFCGLLMFIAVDGFKQKGNPLILFLCVSVFILCGFEHCVANMFYFTLAGAWSVKAAGYLMLMTLGNSVGGMLIPAIKRLESKEKVCQKNDVSSCGI